MTEKQQISVRPAEKALPEAPPVPVHDDRKARGVLPAALRWTTAVVVFAAVGAATAYGITRLERTDVPGLSTQPDGRWEYPVLARPPLPSGSPGPFAEANTAGTHHADLRSLPLPAPAGAEDDRALRGKDGWLPRKDFLAEYAAKDDRAELGQHLTDHGLRHIAARGWSMPDGTRTRIYLLQFDTAAVVDALLGPYLAPYSAPKFPLRGAATSANDETFPQDALVEGVQRVVYDEARPYGGEQVRHAYLAAGDTLALVVQSREGGARAVPFRQTVTLQSQLLG
ncbi:hypothetical protein ACPCBX_33305 [Streptomyces tuirus]|uniref:Uncharacterized protein n=1 Tax=Streptomyces tuirus TaxID=68278 RepID=A0A7G1NID2_9ACTN|nr:hypothetical protein [Streptomyces tuirus]BCL21376.1 hypothetical protein GCM10017668_32190 [Streptomyces tuirus]